MALGELGKDSPRSRGRAVLRHRPFSFVMSRGSSRWYDIAMECLCYETAFEDGWQAAWDEAEIDLRCTCQDWRTETKELLRFLRDQGTGYLLELTDVPVHVQLFLQQLDTKLKNMARDVLNQ